LTGSRLPWTRDTPFPPRNRPQARACCYNGHRIDRLELTVGVAVLGEKCQKLLDEIVAPQVRREAIGQIIERFDLSESRACRLVGLTRSSYRHPPVPDQQAVALSAAIINIAQVRRRFGYRRIHDLLRPEFPKVNHKRVYRLYCVAKLAVRKRKKVKLPVSCFLPFQCFRRIHNAGRMPTQKTIPTSAKPSP